MLGLSATVQDERIIRVLGDEVGIWRITIPDPNNDSLRNEASLSLFRQCVRRALDTIKARHGLTELHVFPVMPVAAAVEFGRVWMPKADMPLTIYDQNKGREGFYKTIQID